MLNSGLEEALAASPTAGPLLAGALRSWQQLGSTAGVALALAGLGEIAAGNGAARRAGQLLGASRALMPATDPLFRAVVPYDLPARLAGARALGGQAAFDQGLAEGQTWTIENAVAAGAAEAAGADA